MDMDIYDANITFHLAQREGDRAYTVAHINDPNAIK